LKLPILNVMNLPPIRFFIAIVPLLFAFPTFGQHEIQGPECKGVVHGVVLGENGEPVNGLNVALDPLGVGLGYVLPHMKTNQRGEYRFEQLCDGRYSVFVSDRDAGYPYSSSYMNQFLYGSRIPEVKIDGNHLDGELTVNVPSKKPAQLQVHVANGKTRTKIEEAEIHLEVNRNRWLSYNCHKFSPCDGKPFLLLPPDQDVLMRVTANGFHEWKNGGTRGKIVHALSGELVTIDVALDPIGK
jgi:hypothetical protein